MHGVGIKSVITKDKWFKEVEKLGGNLETFTANELQDLLLNVYGTSKIERIITKFHNLKESFSQLYQIFHLS